MTFSIAARCPRTGMFGVAVSTAVPAVGPLVPFVAAHTGAVATQAWVSIYLGIDGLAALKDGLDAEAALKSVIDKDPGREVRQLGVVDAEGRSAAFTGQDCVPWAGHITGTDYAIQGNMLCGPETLAGMEQAFISSADEDLPERLVLALEGGQKAGGDKRGRQSAAIEVHSEEEYPYLSLRVDEHPEPVAELRRIYEVAQHQLLPFMETLPTRKNPMGRHNPDIAAFMDLSPQERAERRAP
jgi:uncharacterized Ntn-hydrolase superfamily protein